MQTDQMKSGAMYTFGVIGALACIAILVYGVLSLYGFATRDRQRASLVAAVESACGGGKGKVYIPPDTDDPEKLLDNLDILERQRETIGRCTDAELRLLSYDHGIPFNG